MAMDLSFATVSAAQKYVIRGEVPYAVKGFIKMSPAVSPLGHLLTQEVLCTHH